MPTFNILLAADRAFYGTKTVEAPTWEEAVQTLDVDDWHDHCSHKGDCLEEKRIVHVEVGHENMVAEDIRYDAPLVHSFSVAQYLRFLLATHVGHDGLINRISLYIAELEACGQDPVFKKEES